MAEQPALNPNFVFFRLRLGTSTIHRWGVFADELIPARRKVMEYTGEMVSRRETKRRVETADHIYLFTVNSYWARDGAVGGSGAEYVNHCCEPNLRAQVIGERIFYFAKRDIQPGEELTIDYCFDKRVEKVMCKCGAPGCRGTINLLK